MFCSFRLARFPLLFSGCSFTFTSLKHFLNGLKIFEEKFGPQIMRIKNGFGKFKYLSKIEQMDYCDIKYNLIVLPQRLFTGYSTDKNEDNNKNTSNNDSVGPCLIGEVQFILNFMNKAKHMGHKLYNIQRKHDYVHRVSRFCDLEYNDDNIFTVLDRAIGKRNYSSFGLTLCSRLKESIFANINQTKENVMHRLAEHHHSKGYGLYHSFFIKYCLDNGINNVDQQGKIFGTFLNQLTTWDESPMHYIGYERGDSLTQIRDIINILILII